MYRSVQARIPEYEEFMVENQVASPQLGVKTTCDSSVEQLDLNPSILTQCLVVVLSFVCVA